MSGDWAAKGAPKRNGPAKRFGRHDRVSARFRNASTAGSEPVWNEMPRSQWVPSKPPFMHRITCSKWDRSGSALRGARMTAIRTERSFASGSRTTGDLSCHIDAETALDCRPLRVGLIHCARWPILRGCTLETPGSTLLTPPWRWSIATAPVCRQRETRTRMRIRGPLRCRIRSARP